MWAETDKKKNETRGTNLVVSQESSFFGVLASFSTAAGWTVHLVNLRIGECKSSSVGWHSNDELVLGSAEAYPHAGSVFDRKLLPPFAVGGGCVERSIVSGFSFPFPVEIVRHEIDEIQVAEEAREMSDTEKGTRTPSVLSGHLPGNGWNVISGTYVVWTDRNCRRQQQSWFLHFLGFGFEGFSQFCQCPKNIQSRFVQFRIYIIIILSRLNQLFPVVTDITTAVRYVPP